MKAYSKKPALSHNHSLRLRLFTAKANAERWQRKFKQLADTVPHMVWIANEEGKLTFISKRWKEETGLTLAQLNGKKGAEVIHPDDQDRFHDKMKHAFKTRSSFMVEYRMKNKKGEYNWYVDRAAPTVAQKNFPTKWIGTTTNINERKKVDEQKSEFLGMVTHELKTPLTSVKAFTQILEARFIEKGDMESAKMLGKVDAQLHRLHVVIADLLDITKIESGRLRFNPERFPLARLIDEVVEEMNRLSSGHHIMTTNRASINVYADRDKIAQVLTNLLTNAIKYSPARKNIIVKSQIRAGVVTISIQDFGIGIPKEMHKNIFERFYRAPGRNSETFPGLGLGLYIVKEIMELHNGRVRVKSERGKGSTFYIDIPYEKDAKKL